MDGLLERLLNLRVFQRLVIVCFRIGFAGGWVNFRVDVLRDVSICVCLCVNVWMPDLRLEVCVVESPRVLVLEN